MTEEGDREADPTWFRIGDADFTIGVYATESPPTLSLPDHIRILYSEEEMLFTLPDEGDHPSALQIEIQDFLKSTPPLDCLHELKLLAKLGKLTKKPLQAFSLASQLIEKPAHPLQLAFGFAIAQAALIYKRHQDGALSELDDG